MRTAGAAGLLGWMVLAGALPASAAGPEERAVEYLAREGSAWHAKWGCYSCHNNGDAVRALVSASRRQVPGADALARALNVQAPSDWKPLAAGDLDGKALSRIAFANALVDAVAVGAAQQPALLAVTALLPADQKEDGSFRVDPAEGPGLGAPLIPGSPASLGTALATVSARRALVAANVAAYQPAITRADEWLRRAPTGAILDAAAVVLGLDKSTDAVAKAQRERALATLKSGRRADGGWGADISATTSQPFHTALALLALKAIDGTGQASYSTSDINDAIASGRAYLAVQQNPDGSWKESVRPGKPAASYAQRVSTTAWAAQALIETAEPRSEASR